MILLNTLKILMNMKDFEIFYHGSPRLFAEFDLSHVLEGDGKVKFGYGVYVTSSYKSAAHYSACDDSAAANYVYTVEIPALREDNHIAFKQPVCEAVLKRTEAALGQGVPEKVSGFNAAKVRIVKVDRVSLDQKKQLVEGSEVQVR